MVKEKTRALHKSVAPYTKADNKKSYFQLANTLIPLLLLWGLSYASLQVSVWLTILFSVIGAGFVIRTFIIFHDCTHGSFFHHKRKNDFIGTVTGVITLFPYEKWKREHAIHHASSSNLDKRGVGDIWVMTVDEYVAASKWKRFAYRFYRNPFVMFGLGPLYLLLISNRINRSDARAKERRNTYITNLIVVILYGLMIYFIGWKAFLLVQGIMMYVAAVLGIWLFYIQHTFEDSYFEEDTNWHYVKAAVEGSSYYELPRFLQWLTGNIGFHHVHHLAPRIPNYHLEEAHNTTPPLHHATTITLWTSLDSLKYRLYDPENMEFVTFRDVRHLVKNERMTNIPSVKQRRTSIEGK